MKNLNLLVVEGNLQKENETFKKSGIPTHAESLKDSLSYYSNNLNYINEIQNNILNISEIHLHISKAAYIEQFNDFVEYKSTIIKHKVKVKINI